MEKFYSLKTLLKWAGKGGCIPLLNPSLVAQFWAEWWVHWVAKLVRGFFVQLELGHLPLKA